MVLRASGHRWRVFAQLVTRTYGDTCWICQHGGARQVDHLEPVTENPAAAWDLAGVRPAHGAPGNPCPSCTARCGRKIHCNQIRGMGSVERARRIIAELGQAYQRGEVQLPPSGTGYAAQRARDRPPQAARPDQGRDW